MTVNSASIKKDLALWFPCCDFSVTRQREAVKSGWSWTTRSTKYFKCQFRRPPFTVKEVHESFYYTSRTPTDTHYTIPRRGTILLGTQMRKFRAQANVDHLYFSYPSPDTSRDLYDQNSYSFEDMEKRLAIILLRG